MLRRRALLGLLGAGAVTATALAVGIAGAAPPGPPRGPDHTQNPIKHLVVIFQENVSFDHYFGTYPDAANPGGQNGGPTFTARPGTPALNGLLPATDSSLPAALQHPDDLTTTNPNSSLPMRLDWTPNGVAGSGTGQETCDQDHSYSDEEQSFDGNADGSAFKMDQFVQSVGKATGKTPDGNASCDPRTVMDYYDGNSTTAFWNYAQHYSMSDNSFDTSFGPSAPGAINLVSGNTGGVDTSHEAKNPSIASSTSPNADITSDGNGGFSLTSDAQPYWDDCSTRDAVGLTGTNIGDELNAAGISWGWFQGGFRPTTTFADAIKSTQIGAAHPNQTTSQFFPDEFTGSFTGKYVPPSNTSSGLTSGLGTTGDQALCNTYHAIGVALGSTSAADPPNNGGLAIPSDARWGYKDDYIAHHEPFQYYASTANPHHLTVDDSQLHGPGSLSTVGTDTQSFSGAYGVGPQFDTPNHNYDSSDFDALVAAIDDHKLPPDALPAVTFLKAPGYQDGHAQYSNPRDEQAFVVKEVNALEQSPDWSSTAVVVNYDDSDGWYDHYYTGVTNPSNGVGADNLTGPTVLGKIQAGNPTSGHCGSGKALGPGANGQQGRCGFSSRLPMMLISPCAAPDTVDHHISDQASIINFIEYNLEPRSDHGLLRPGAGREGQGRGDSVRPRGVVRLLELQRAGGRARPGHRRDRDVGLAPARRQPGRRLGQRRPVQLEDRRADPGHVRPGRQPVRHGPLRRPGPGLRLRRREPHRRDPQRRPSRGSQPESREPHERRPQGRQDHRRLVRRRDVVEHDLPRRHEFDRRRRYVPGPPHALDEQTTGGASAPPYARRYPSRSSMQAKNQMNVIATRPRSATPVAGESAPSTTTLATSAAKVANQTTPAVRRIVCPNQASYSTTGTSRGAGCGAGSGATTRTGATTRSGLAGAGSTGRSKATTRSARRALSLCPRARCRWLCASAARRIDPTISAR